MCVFTGVLRKNQKDTRFLEKDLDTVLQSDGNKYKFTNENISLYSSAKQTLFIDDRSGLVIMGDILLHNTEELKTRLRIDDIHVTNAQILLESYLTWGKDCLVHIVGHFSFIIWDEKRQELFCSRDQLGQKAFYYYLSEEYFFFSNKIQVLSAYDIADELDDEWAIHFFQLLNLQDGSTAFKKIKYLRPGYTISIGKNDFSEKRYWNLAETKVTHVNNIEQAVEGLNWHFSNAIAASISDASVVGIELTGGLDSGSIAAFAQQLFNKEQKSVIAYSNISAQRKPQGNAIDEWENAASLAAYLGIKEHKGIDHADGQLLDILKRITDILGYPSNFMLAAKQTGIYAAAQQMNVNVLLSGFGGNELVTEYANVRYISGILREGKTTDLVKYFLKQNDPRYKAFLRTGYHYARFLLNTEKKLKRDIVHDSYKKLILHDHLLNDKTLQNEYYEQIYYPANQTLREKSIYRIYSGITTERIITGNLIAASYGIQYQYPLLYTPLMEYYYNLPDEWKANNVKGRALIRLVLKDMLPGQIVHQTKHTTSNTVPFADVEKKENYDDLLDYCLAIPAGSKIFDYINRKKIEILKEHRQNVEYDKYKFLLCIAAFDMFIQNIRKLPALPLHNNY